MLLARRGHADVSSFISEQSASPERKSRSFSFTELPQKLKRRTARRLRTPSPWASGVPGDQDTTFNEASHCPQDAAIVEKVQFDEHEAPASEYVPPLLPSLPSMASPRGAQSDSGSRLWPGCVFLRDPQERSCAWQPESPYR